MKHQAYGTSLLVTALAVLALSGPARAQNRVPFKGASSGVVTVAGTSPPFVNTRVDGKGDASLLGSFTLSALVVLNGKSGGPPPVGVWVLTAPNGDKLFVTFVGYGIDPTHGGGLFTIVGGTGRFQGAIGSYTQSITFAGTPGSSPSTAYTDVIEGSIYAPGLKQWEPASLRSPPTGDSGGPSGPWRGVADAGYQGAVGSHYAGPTWESASGSKVVGTVLERCTPDPAAIPWLLLEAVSSEGPGIFDQVTFIQRVNTVGGLAPTAPGGVPGEMASVPYTTENCFYQAQD
jgi:hypothetical protein